MAASDDTEITLGTGKMLALFFGLVALCAVFFGMGYKLGRSSAQPEASVVEASPAASASNTVRPSAVKPVSESANAPSPDVALYKSESEKSSDASATGAAGDAGNQTPAPAATGPTPAAPASAPSPGGYLVQVAAVSKQDDGEALVEALKKKQYPAFSALGPDKLFHVQVGPYADIKNAEEMRAKLVADGYNPILKK